jgi:hypothetical protein
VAALSAKYSADPDFDVVYAIRADYEASQRRWAS